jgi:hypothetical protein
MFTTVGERHGLSFISAKELARDTSNQIRLVTESSVAAAAAAE